MYLKIQSNRGVKNTDDQDKNSNGDYYNYTNQVKIIVILVMTITMSFVLHIVSPPFTISLNPVSLHVPDLN